LKSCNNLEALLNPDNIKIINTGLQTATRDAMITESGALDLISHFNLDLNKLARASLSGDSPEEQKSAVPRG
jgi:hypothetical protein